MAKATTKKKMALGADSGTTGRVLGVEEEDVSTAEIEAYAAIQRVKEQLGSEEGSVFLRRRDERGQMAVLGSFPAVDFSIDQVVKDFGGGRYEATFWKGSENLGSHTFSVDEAIPRRLPKSFVDGEPGAAPLRSDGAPRPDMGPYIHPELAALREIMSRQADLLNQLIVQIATTPKEKGDALSVRDIIDLMQAKGDGGGDKRSFESVADLIREGIELGRKVSGKEEGDPDSYWPFLNKLADPVSRILTHAAAREGMDTGHALPPGRTAPPAPSGGAPLPPNASPWLMHLAPHVPALVAWARSDKDPALYAAVIIDNFPPGGVLEVTEAAKVPGFVENTVAMLPLPLRPYTAWCKQVLTEMQKILTTPPDGGIEDGDGDGDGGGE